MGKQVPPKQEEMRQKGMETGGARRSMKLQGMTEGERVELAMTGLVTYFQIWLPQVGGTRWEGGKQRKGSLHAEIL